MKKTAFSLPVKVDYYYPVEGISPMDGCIQKDSYLELKNDVKNVLLCLKNRTMANVIMVNDDPEAMAKRFVTECRTSFNEKVYIICHKVDQANRFIAACVANCIFTNNFTVVLCDGAKGRAFRYLEPQIQVKFIYIPSRCARFFARRCYLDEMVVTNSLSNKGISMEEMFNPSLGIVSSCFGRDSVGDNELLEYFFSDLSSEKKIVQRFLQEKNIHLRDLSGAIAGEFAIYCSRSNVDMKKISHFFRIFLGMGEKNKGAWARFMFFIFGYIGLWRKKYLF